MADKTLGGPAKGITVGGDQTALPGQAAGKLPFGIQNPLSTGAPGTGGTGLASDPTLQAPVPTAAYGAQNDDADTGAPGGNGVSAHVATGATYTLDSYGASPRQNMTGGSVDTEAQSNKYGTDTGIPGLHVPDGTGAPGTVGTYTVPGGHGVGNGPAGHGGAAGGSITDGSERIH
jgi:hypothetical protein